LHPYDDIAIVAQYAQSILPEPQIAQVERVAEGGSTIVYRVRGALRTYYLRICPEEGVSLGAEAAVHQRLSAIGLRVPRVLHVEPLNLVFQRSLMLTTEIPGHAIGDARPYQMADAIVRQAGRELARINQMLVQGYGWANRLAQPSGGIAAEYPSLPLWLQAHFAAPIQALAGCDVLSGQDVQLVARLLGRACELFRDEPAALAHGDFDLTHIYCEHGAYTGIIDFGEIRGAHWLYDLGHFAIEHSDLLPSLIEGYQEIRPLAATDMYSIRLTGLLIAAQRVGRRILQGRAAHPPYIEYVVAWLARFKVDGQA
jgi:Ser/Thr protein kinase RdoA (MazF antagonist)